MDDEKAESTHHSAMALLFLFNKPFQVLSQFTDTQQRKTLADFISYPGVYPAGRLDWDSEGLLLLTGDGALQARIAEPRFKLPKTYLVQVEGTPSEDSLERLRRGIELKDGPTRPAIISRNPEPPSWQRHPPVRYRKTVSDCWLSLTITEGRNRQVRRMTAAIGHPTLRLVRWSVGDWNVQGLTPGEYRQIDVNLPTGNSRSSSRPYANDRRPARRAGAPRPKHPARR